MPYTLRIRQLVLALFPISAALAAACALIGSGSEVTAWFSAYRAENPELTRIMRILTDWGNPVFYPVYAFMLWKGWKSGDRALVRFALCFVTVQVAVSFGIVRVCKILLGNPRPGVEGIFEMPSFSSSFNSLPSGHSAEITGAAVPLALAVRSRLSALGLGIFLAAVAFSRVYLGRHHLGDVFFGVLLGTWAACLIDYLKNGTHA